MIAYLFSSFPVPSQTFCDWEMLAHEEAGFPLLVASLNPPPSLFRHGHYQQLQAEILYPPSQGIPKDLPIPPEVQTIANGIRTRYGDRFRPQQRALNATYFASKLKALGVRHCHVHFANQATLTAMMMKPLGLTYSFTAHGQDFTTDLGDDGLLQELANAAKFIVGVSDSAKALLKEMCPDAVHKIKRVYNGIDLDSFPTALPETEGTLRLVSVGRLIEFKGFFPLLDACALLRDRKLDFHLDIVGDGPLREELQAHINHHKLQQHVTLQGLLSLADIRKLLQQAQLFTLASIVDSQGAMDTLPTVITEALACRLPVVSTQLAGIPEMVAHEETGLLVPPNDPQALADAIARLAEQPSLRKAMGIAGRIKAEASFALSTCSRRLRSFLEPLATGRYETKNVLHLVCEPSAISTAETTEVLPHGDTVVLDAELPQASILEGEWIAQSQLRNQIEDLRKQLPKKHQDQTFYDAARQALFLVRQVRQRPHFLIHAARSNSALTAWILSQISGTPLALTIESEPSTPRSLLRALIPACASCSLGDAKLRGEFDTLKFEDTLGLAPPAHKETKVGPIKIRQRQKTTTPNQETAQAWLQILNKNSAS